MSAYDLILRGGLVVSSERIERTDVAILNGKIAALGDLSGASAAEVVDLHGLHLLPGVIDTQVHFREPGLEHKEDLESGSRAAVMGGVTTYFEMPNTNPLTTTPGALSDKLRRAAGRSWANYGFFVGASRDNLGDLAIYEGLPGSPGIKIFMGSSTGPLLVESDENLRVALRNGQRRFSVHAEDEARLRERKAMLGPGIYGARDHDFLRDAVAAELATRRITELCRETGRPGHVLHISTGNEAMLIPELKKRADMTFEVTPQHLRLDTSLCEKLGTKLQMNPPVRSPQHRVMIQEAFRRDYFDVIGSDHAPHTLSEKELPYPQSPSGMPGVQTLLPNMLWFVKDGLCDLQKVVRMTSERPAELFGIEGKGTIEVGMDADLVALDPDQLFRTDPEWLQSKCGWSPFEGMDLAGKPVHVWVGGHWTVRESQLQGPPQGTMVKYTWK